MRIEEGTEFLDRLKDTVHEQYFEIERLNSIIKDLEEWLELMKIGCEAIDEYAQFAYQLVLNKIKELKER